MRILTTLSGAHPDPTAAAVGESLRVCEREGLWLDVEAPDEDDYAILRDTFRFHPLTIEDIRQQNQRPKLEEYSGYSFLVLFLAEWREGELRLLEHHLYVSRSYLVTVHHEPAPVLEDLRRRVAESPELARGDPRFLTYLVVDGLVDALFPVLDRLDDTIDALEDAVVERAEQAQLREIYRLKHVVTQLRQLLGAQRDLFQRLVTHSLDQEAGDLHLYYRDIEDHIVRQYETVDSLRDLLTGVMDVYLSTVSNRLNATMKQLTVIASLFLPLSFLTGFFGQNFGFLVTRLLPGLPAFLAGLGLMAATVAGQLVLFRRRGWI